MHLRFIIKLICCCICATGWGRSGDIVLESPSSVLRVKVFKGQAKEYYYSVFVSEKKVVLPSKLGITLVGKQTFETSDDLKLLNSTTIKDSFTLLKNNFRTHHIQYKKYIIDAGGQVIEFAVFDNACAFRYQLPAGKKRVTGEQTEFVLNGSERTWFFERTSDWKLKSYAGLWMQTRWDSLDRISPTGPIQGKPVIAQLKKGTYLFITEAGLYNFSGMRLSARQNTLSVNYTEGENGFFIESANGVNYTPWRVIGLADNLNDLVNQPFIAALNEKPNASLYSDMTYIKPGKSAWSWISRDSNYLKPEFEKIIIDAAAELNYQYTLIDDGWEEKWKDKWDVLKDLVDYARTRKIGVWIWKDSKFLRDEVYCNAFLDTLNSLGVAGVKIDFMNSEAKDLVDFEINFLKAAAKRKLMVNFHGCHTSTGEYRSYPNEMTREGIRGMELNIMKEPIPAWHNAALPFTRFITGPADYTPAYFSNRGSTSLTHQLALLYMFDSPFQCIAENPEMLLKDTLYRPVLPLLKQLRTTWDSTIVLEGSKIGECAIIAKKDGLDWYIAAVNGIMENSSKILDLSFLERGAHYTATIISDDGHRFKREIVRVDELSQKPISIPPNGGLVIYVKKNVGKQSF